MDAILRFAILCVVGLIGCGPAAADEPYQCKNHYILSRPCLPGWVPVNEGLADLDVHVVAIDPADPETLYAGGLAFLSKSVDGGGSWKTTSLNLAPQVLVTAGFGGPPGGGFALDHVVNLVAFDAARPGLVYAATHLKTACAWYQQRLFKSVDGGATWDADLSMVVGGCEWITALVFDPHLAGQTYFSHYDYIMGDTYAPFRTSVDGGASWNYYFQPLVPVLVADPREPGTIYGGTLPLTPGFYDEYGAGVLKSSDRGVTWAPTGLTGRAVSAITAIGGVGGGIYAATYTQGVYPQPPAFDGIYRSADGGESWTSRSAGLDALMGSRTLVTTLVAQADNPDALYAGTSDAGVWRSTDGGATWFAMNAGLPSLAIRALAITPGQSRTLYAATPAGVFRFNDTSLLPRMRASTR